MGKKVLVAEDSQTIGTFIKDFLEADGYEVIHVTDGQQALDKICQERPDLVILDVILPKMDGYRIARFLRKGQDEELRRIAIIILSGREALVGEAAEAIGLVEAYLLKPFDKNEVLEKVRELLK